MGRILPLLLLPLVAGFAFWFHVRPVPVPVVAESIPSHPIADRGVRAPAESGFRESIEAALKMSPPDSIARVTQFLERRQERVTTKDATWFFEKYHAEYYHGQPRLVLDHWLAVLNDVARARPAEAARLLEGKDRLKEQDGSLLMSVWAASRPLDAIAWAKQGGKERAEWLLYRRRELTVAWAAHDLDGLLSWLLQGHDDADAVAALQAFKDQRGIAAVREWLETFGGEGSPLSASVRMAAADLVVAGIHSSQDRQSVMTWIESREDPAERWQALKQVVPRMVSSEPAEVMDWLERLSPQSGFPLGLAEASMNDWAAKDLQAAGEWLNEHRGSAAADSYIWGYALQVAVEDPAAALEWSKHVQRESTKSPAGGSSITELRFVAASDGGFVVENQGAPFDAGYLEQLIAVTASAAAFVKDPDHSGITLTGHLPLKYTPTLIKESPEAEPQLRMIRNPPNSCTLLFGGKWVHPFPVYHRQADGTLRYEPPVQDSGR